MKFVVYAFLFVVIMVIRNNLKKAEKYFKYYAQNPMWETDLVRGCDRLGEAQALSIVGMTAAIVTIMEMHGIPAYQEIEGALRVACGTMILTTVQVCFIVPKTCINYFKKTSDWKIIRFYTIVYTSSTVIAIAIVALLLKLMEG